MKNSEMNALVKSEAKNLKKFATQDELSNLDFGKFDPDFSKTCIYGQLTGYCHSERAQELIKKCCKKVYRATEENISNCLELNGKPKERISGVALGSAVNYWSPIEVFVAQHDNNANGKLINYLKGINNTLEI